MKVSGFTFIKNAIKYDYPIVEAISSILPVCDEFIVALGNCDDGTRELLLAIDSTDKIGNPKLKIVDTIWDENIRKDGKVLANETNKALTQVANDSDWAFYIQGDEVVHEKYLDNIYSAMLKYKDKTDVEGLLFKYLHFYGNYEYVGDSRRWYRNEIRIIRPHIGIISYGDAQGFKIINAPNVTNNNQFYEFKNSKLRKLNVVLIDAYIYHYGWVKPPAVTFQKNIEFQKLWHTDNEVKEWIECESNTKLSNLQSTQEYDYSAHIDSIKLFDDSHPQVMKNRINSQHWQINLDVNKKKYSFSRKILYFIEKHTGWRIGEYKNYIKFKI